MKSIDMAELDSYLGGLEHERENVPVPRKDYKPKYIGDPSLKDLDTDDLNNLKYIDPDRVRELVEKVNSLSEAKLKGKELVIGIGTGGTIAMKKDPKTGLLVPDMNFDSILKQAGANLQEDYVFFGLDALRIDSSQMHPDYIADISLAIAYLQKNIKRKHSGFLILHGTDTLTPSAQRTAMQLGDGFPSTTVHTGAQKPMSNRKNDARDNIINSLHFLTTAKKDNVTEAAIVFGSRALLAVGSVKTTGMYTDAFESPMHKMLLDNRKLEEPLDAKLPSWCRTFDAGRKFNPKISRESSDVIFVPADMYNDPVEIANEIVRKKPSGVILETYGADTASEMVVAGVGLACERLEIPGFTVSSVEELPGTGTYVSSDLLIKAGLTPLGIIPSTARAKADRILTSIKDPTPDVLSENMRRNLINESPEGESQRILEY